jgi:hypothetical protein
MTEPVLSADWAGRDAESLLWLASYPRSGNTFTRALLANYFASDNEAYDINRLRHFIPADTSPHIWKQAPDAPSDPHDMEAVWKARPAVIAHYRKTMGQQALACLKTHIANAESFGSKGFDFRENDRAIYIVRHPLDVLLSFADFNGLEIDAAIAVMLYAGCTIRSDQVGGLEVRGSWMEHVDSWTIAPPCRSLLVRYEELCSAPGDVLRAILTFLNIPIIDEKIRHAVTASRFEKLRYQETAGKFVELPADAAGQFFRQGKALQWLQQLGPNHAYKLADACEDVMARFGYTHPRDVLFDGRNAIGPIALRPRT